MKTVHTALGGSKLMAFKCLLRPTGGVRLIVSGGPSIITKPVETESASSPQNICHGNGSGVARDCSAFTFV